MGTISHRNEANTSAIVDAKERMYRVFGFMTLSEDTEFNF
jgi:hypothetical protein